MIRIEWNPGHAPSVLEALQDARLAALCAKAAAEAYTDATLDWIAEGKSFVGRTGQLEQSIGWRPEGGGAVVYASAEHAGYIEQGTRGPYPIRPKPGRKALRLPIPGGGYLIRKLVMHPGIKARPFFFADFQARENKMLDALRGVLATKLGG
jgi:hypothetical protein